MFKSIEGIFRDGRVELLEEPPEDVSGKVIITFLSTSIEELPPSDAPTPMRREGELLVYDGRLTGDVDATIDAVREERIRQFFPETGR
jgi:hypothetical protein